MVRLSQRRRIITIVTIIFTIITIIIISIITIIITIVTIIFDNRDCFFQIFARIEG